MAVLAFFTVGDHRPLAQAGPRCLRMNASEMFEVYARQASGPGAPEPIGAQSIGEVETEVRRHRRRLSRILFVGHASNADGYFFRQRSSGPGIFEATDNGLMALVADALIEARSGTLPSVEFHACDPYESPLVEALRGAIGRGLASGCLADVAVFRGRIFFDPHVTHVAGHHGCSISGWSNRVGVGGRRGETLFHAYTVGRDPGRFPEHRSVVTDSSRFTAHLRSAVPPGRRSH